MKPKKRPTAQSDTDDTANNEGSQNVQKSPNNKKVRLFSAKEFRTKLKTAERKEALVNFLSLCYQEHGESAIKEYLDKGGNCLELLQILDSDPESSHCVILNLVNHILLQIISNHPTLHSQNLEACHFFLSTKFPLINKMLSFGSITEERKTILKFLATFVAFSNSLGREILQNINFNLGNLQLLTKQTGEKDSVRSAFIKFVVAFLLEGHFPTISLLLEKKGVLSVVVQGLTYDDADVVCIILSALKEYVLENPMVSKTMKMKLFNTSVIAEIVNLYNWKGPSNFNLNTNKKKKQNINKPIEINEYDKSKVNETVHGFLLTLCTSHRFGVIFSDHTIGLGKTGSNNLLFSVLDKLEKAWEHSYASDLILQICKSCPDLVKTVWNKLKGTLEPRDSENWRKAINFATSLLMELSPECIKYCFEELSLTQRIQVIQVLVAPLAVLKVIIPENCEFASQSTKYHVYIFISKSLQAIKSYIDYFQNYFIKTEFLSFKDSLSNYIYRNFPDVSIFLKDINMAFEELNEMENLKLLKVLFDIFEFYEKLCPQYLEDLFQITDSNFNFNLDDFYERLESIKNNENISDDAKNLIQNLEINLIKTFLNINETLFNTSSRAFYTIFPSLIVHYRNTKDKNIYEILERMFLLIDILRDNRDEIKVWIDSIFYSDNFEICVGKMLVQSLKDIGENIHNYLLKENINELDPDDDDVELYHKNDISSILEALKNGREITTLIYLSHKSLSPLVRSVLNYLAGLTDKNELNSLKDYLNYTLINLLHLQTTPSNLVAIVLQEKYKKVVPKTVLKYFNSWKGKTDIQISEKAKGTLKILQNFWTTEDNYKGVLTSDSLPSLSFFLLNMCMFYVSNFAKLEILDTNYVNRTLELIKLFLEGENHGKCTLKTVMETIFYNPLLLKYFSPLKVIKTASKQICTNFIYENLKIFKGEIINIENLDKVYLESLLKPYRRKVLVCLEKVLEKPKKLSSEKYENLLETIKIFGLNEEDCKIILKKCLEVNEKFLISEDNNQLSLLYHLLGYSLEVFLETSIKKTTLEPLEGDIIKALSQTLSFLNMNENSIKTSDLANALNKYLQQFPHSFEFVSRTLFESLLKKGQYCAENSQLAVTILRHKKNYLSLLECNMQSLSSKKGLILPLLEVAIEQNCDDILLKRIFEEIEPVILKCLEKPQKANQHIEKHIDSINTLIKHFMSLEFCETYFDKIKKFSISENFLYKIISVLFTKVIENNAVTTIRVFNYIITSVHLLNTFIKNKIREDDSWKKLEEMISVFNNNLIRLKENELDLKNIAENESFKQYCKSCLKHGIANNNFLLNNLNTFILLGTFDENNVSIIFDMATAHSEFLNTLLDKEEKTKAELLRLIFFCCNNWPQLIQKNHLPVILSAYHATCRKSDMIILDLLKLYETHSDKSNFYTYKPFLFGSAAASHYSVRQNLQNALWRQPKVGDVLDLLEEKVVNNTIEYCSSDTDLHQSIENISDEIENYDVYNLAFLLPLFSSLLAPENVVPTYKFTRSGALSLTVLALTSKVQETRLASCYVLYRFYTHLEAKPDNRDKILWLRYVEAFCKGVAAFKSMRLNSFAAIFWAKMALILTMPMHPLYLSSSSYLTAKVNPNLRGIPELYTWLHDSSVGFEEHQLFILKLLKDGMKTHLDFSTASKSMAFKLIMELCNSCVSTRNVRLHVVNVIESATKINFGAEKLVRSHGLLSWLLHFTQKFTLDDYSFLESVLNVLVHIVGNEQFDLFIVNTILIFVIDSGLISCLRTKCLEIFLNLLCKCVSRGCTISKKQLNVLIDYVNDKFCNYLLIYGKKYVILEDYASSDPIIFLLRKLILLCIDDN